MRDMRDEGQQDVCRKGAGLEGRRKVVMAIVHIISALTAT